MGRFVKKSMPLQAPKFVPLRGASFQCAVARSERSERRSNLRWDRFASLAMALIFLAGCASAQTTGYISRIDHPYERTFYAGFEKVVSSTMYVLKKRGWKVSEESRPSLYERDDRYDNSGYQNLLVITQPRKKFDGVSLAAMHLNVFIHGVANTSDVEIRYEAHRPWTTFRNDRLIEGILNAIQQDLR